MKASIIAAAAALFWFATAAQATENTNAAALFGGGSLSDETMAQLRGGDGLSSGLTSSQIGEDSGNSCVVCYTGSNGVNGNAFSNATGIITVIQNTGNNALLQNTTQVNVNIH